MADKKISALTSASTPLAGTEVLPIVQSGSTVKVAVSDLTAGRAVAATALTMSTGSLVPSTAGQGVNFTANTPAAGMTSQLLNWYEEGTWTPVFGFATNGDLAVAYSSQIGWYTRVGSLVTAHFRVTASSLTYTTASGAIQITGLPFPNNSTAGWYATGPVTIQAVILTAASATATFATLRMTAGTSIINVQANGSNTTPISCTTTSVPAATLPGFTGVIIYRV